MTQEVKRVVWAYRARVIDLEKAIALLADLGYGRERALETLNTQEEIRI